MAERKKRSRKKKVCFFCQHKVVPSYKNDEVLKRMLTERGKIVPRRMSGTCAKHQRILATEVKRARHLALVPFVAENMH